MGGFLFGLDPRRSTEVVLFVGGPPTPFTVVLGVFHDLFDPVELVAQDYLAQVVLFVAVVAAFALVDIFAHGCLLGACSSRWDGQS